MGLLAAGGAEPRAADDAVVGGGEAAHGAEGPRGLGGGRDLRREVVGRLGVVHGVVLEELGKVLAESGRRKKVDDRRIVFFSIGT